MTAICHRRDPAEYPPLLVAEAERFIEAISGAPEDLSVPTCPGWTARQIGEHVGGLYRWAEAHVRTGSPRRIRGSELNLEMPKDFDAQPDWIRAGLDGLVATLKATNPDKELWAWGSDKKARFWGRRMLFETTIHRADVELAVERSPKIEQATAADGIDEFLDNLPHAAYFAPDVDNLRADDETLRLAARDVELGWSIRLLADRLEWSHESGDANATLSGRAGDLLLFVYGRRSRDEMETDGDAALMDLWVRNSRI